ncbi:MAG: LysR family transcriptional regulator [Catenulispora sp.]|nr:LysR family transcriptional regulator [Catenulispora sp.]
MDLNLLRVLDVLLQEGSVTRAADQLGTSPAAVSRQLGRLRRAVGDPLLVRAGQHLVPTPRAEQLRDQVSALLAAADDVLRPGAGFDPAAQHRTFRLQASELLSAALAPKLLAGIAAEAEAVNVVFSPEALEGGPALRQGWVDVEVGVLGNLDPEILTRPLITTGLVGVARAGHPLFAKRLDVRRFAAFGHIGISRTGRIRGPIDTLLQARGLARRVPVVVPSHTAALLLARDSDLIGLWPDGWLPQAVAALGLRTFPIPLPLDAVEFGMAWHPRTDTDPGHRWFRNQVAAALSTIHTDTR